MSQQMIRISDASPSSEHGAVAVVVTDMMSYIIESPRIIAVLSTDGVVELALLHESSAAKRGVGIA